MPHPDDRSGKFPPDPKPMPREPRETVELFFGALAPPIAKQLAGMTVARSDVKHWQLDADAITRLAVRDLIPGSAVKAARQKVGAKGRRQREAREPGRRRCHVTSD